MLINRCRRIDWYVRVQANRKTFQRQQGDRLLQPETRNDQLCSPRLCDGLCKLRVLPFDCREIERNVWVGGPVGICGANHARIERVGDSEP